MFKNSFLTLLIVFCLSSLSANNLKIQNVSFSGSTVTFTISWENSWRMSTEPSNYDAVWVFIKTQDCNTYDRSWRHVTMNTSGHSTNNPLLKIDSVVDNKGVFIKRKVDGFGTISNSIVQLSVAGTFAPSNVNFEVHGIEMVYVPQGAFAAGDGAATAANLGFKQLNIASEGSLAVSALYAGNSVTSNHVAIPPTYPKGYDAFYCMKYEITQGQYVAFLNSLNLTQQNSRTAVVCNSPAGTYAMQFPASTTMKYRNGIRIVTPGSMTQSAVYGMDLNANGIYNEQDDGENVACNYLNWSDLMAYLDWSALRPMTELEFEKACRGSWAPISNEKAWGNATATPASSVASALSNIGLATEISNATIAVNSGLCAYNNTGALPTSGPLRVGFAATPISYRTKAGASFWGIMELSGNVYEQTYSIGYLSSGANLPNFTGTNGDGELEATGESSTTLWPSPVNTTIVRGGSFASAIALISVSDRANLANTTFNLNRHEQTGGRGVRRP